MWRPSEKRPPIRERQIAAMATSGARDNRGRQIPYHEDPLRNPAATFIPNGYLVPGYDTGRGG